MGNIIAGLISIALGIWGISVWWWSVAEFLRGVVPIVLVLGGLVALGAGIRIYREENEDLEKDEEDDSEQ